MQENKAEGKIFLTSFHHSDLTWQFPYAEYDAIREQQLNIVMDFFAKYPGYGFILDQAYALQNYLERNPEQKEKMKELFDGGKGPLELIGGYSIPDMNLCSGESFLRNCMLGQQYYEDEFGCAPTIASLMDAFGLPFQVPQMLAKLGYKYLVPGRMPNAPKELDINKPFVWEGEGETSIVVAPNSLNVDKTSYITNVPVLFNESERFEKTLTDLQNTSGNVLAYYMTEIQMLDEAFFKHLEEVNQKADAKRKVTFGRLADYCKTLCAEELPRYGGEFNPVFTGCYTTRIGVKQKIRAAENALFNAELACALAGKEADLSKAWMEMSLAQFHDAACGCHHDPCNVDVNAKLDLVLACARQEYNKAFGQGSGKALAVLNPSAYTQKRLTEAPANALPAGVPIQQDGEKFYFCAQLPAHGVRSFATGASMDIAQPRQCSTQGYCGETDHFAFDFSQPLPKIRSKRYGRSVFGQQKFGEVLFRHESGSMWDETLLEIPYGMEWEEEQVSQVEEGPLFIKVTTTGSVKPGKRPMSGNTGAYWPGFGSLSFKKEYIFPRELPHFSLRLTVEFSGHNTKVMLRIPVELDPLHAKAVYDTPFAAVERRPYFEVPHKYEATVKALLPGDYAHAHGDFPALHWVDYCDENIGLAVANSGTPGHQIVGKDIFVSLLRSGTQCKDGTMYPQPGAYDNGTHVFDFAFTDHLPSEPEAAIELGSVLNRAPVCVANAAQEAAFESAVWFDQPNIVVSAVYQKDGALIVRAYETLGRKTQCAMQCAKAAVCYNADVRGARQQPQPMEQIAFAPFEIKTFALTL